MEWLFSILSCFPRQWPSRLGIITPFGVIYIFNMIMFMIILVSVLRHGSSKGSKKETKLKKLVKRAIITIVLAIMFGVGWIFGVLGSSGLPSVISRVCQFIFIFVITFQGFFIFLLHPVRSKDAREEWKKWVYYVTCRAQAYERQLKQIKAVSSGDHSGASKPKTSSTATISSSPRGPSSSSRGASNYGYNQHKPSVDSASSTIASRFGFTGGRRPSDTDSGKMGNLLSIPGTYYVIQK